MDNNLIPATMKENDQQAKWLIGIFSFVVFAAVTLLSRFKLHVDLGFNVHIFAAINAVINSIIAVLLVAALLAVKNGQYLLHKKLMMSSLILSVIFLVSYIAHHLLAGETKFGGTGTIKVIYLIILFTHIFLAAIILPFILYTAYRALTGNFPEHKRLAKVTFPLWLYVAITGPVVYFMISPYYV